jgi:hypothetical protein
MMSGFPLALDTLLARERPSPAEAVAIVLELCRQVRPAGGGSAVTPPVTRATVLLDTDGAVATRGGAVTEDDQTVSLLGHLLLELVDDRPETSRLRRVAARAARSLPGGSRAVSVRRLASALRRNAPSNPRRAVAAFVHRASGCADGAAPILEETSRVAFAARGAARRLLSPLWRRIA